MFPGLIFISVVSIMFCCSHLRKKYKDYSLNKKVKKMIFKKTFRKYTSDEECVICQENFDGTLKCRQLYCNHIFHSKCIYEWFNEKLTCPLCNQNIRTKDNNDIMEVNEQYLV